MVYKIEIKVDKDEVVQAFAFLNTCMVSCDIVGLPGADVVSGLLWKVCRATHKAIKNKKRGGAV